MYRTLRENHLLVPPEYCFYRSRLSGNEKGFYDEICKAIAGRKRNVKLLGGMFDTTKVFHAVFRDQPMFFFLDTNTVKGVTFGLVSEFSWSFRLGETEIESMIRRMDRRLAELPLPQGGTELDCVVRIHNLMQDMGLHTGPGGWEDHCIAGPLLYGHTVCEGSAKLFGLLCAMCGVWSVNVSGTGRNYDTDGSHGWNIVRLGNLYAHVDVYWDCLQWTDRRRTRCYTYLNLGDEQIRKDHEWNEPGIPACPTEKYSYFVLNNARADSLSEFKAYVRQQKQKGRSEIMLRLGPHLEEDMCMREMDFLVSVFGYGRFWHSYNQQQRVFCLWTEKI